MLHRLNIVASGKSPVVQKLAVLASLFILTVVGMLVYTIATLHEQRLDGLVVDLAGRQRMLNQRHMKEILLASAGLAADYNSTRQALSQTLEALTNGGPVILNFDNPESVVVPSAPTTEIQAKLAIQKNLMQDFTFKADEFLQLSRSDPRSHSRLEELLMLNARVQDAANDTVRLFAEHSASKIAELIRWEAAIGLLAGVLAVLLTRQLAKANRAMENEITDRKRAEADLHTSEEKQVEAFRQSDALKSALLSSASHELRTPLTAIKASVSSLLENPDRMTDAVRKEFLQGIHQDIDYLNRLVDNLLDMSRIEAGMLVPRCEWYPVEDLVEGAIRRAGVPLQDRPLDVLLAEEAASVFVDGVEIQQVLVNLLDNAMKYSPRGSRIRIEARSIGQAVEIRVSNSGAGIPPDDLERVFERFYRVPSGRMVHGSGLGLAICKGIVVAHGGRIWAESTPGKETVMIFTLPQNELPPRVSLEHLNPSSVRS